MSKVISILIWFLYTAITIAQSDTSVISLKTCIDAALNNYSGIQKSENEVIVSTLEYKTAKSALYPGISSETSIGFSDQYSIGNNYRTGSADIAANQVIWQHGKIKASINQANYICESTNSLLKLRKRDIVLEVKNTYINCLLQFNLYQIAKDNVSKAGLFLEYAQERYKLGIARKSDVLKAESDLSEAEFESNIFLNEFDKSRNALAMLTSIPTGKLSNPENIFLQEPGLFIPEKDSLLNAVLTDYPEILALHNIELSQTEKIKQANASLYPQLSTKAGYEWSYNPTFKEQKGWYSLVALRWDLFNGNAGRHRLQTELIKKSVYENQSKELKDRTINDLNNVLIDLKQAEEQISLSNQLIKSTSENLEIAKAQYKEGVGSMLELTDARINNLIAKQNNIKAMAAYQLAIANLERLTNNSYDN